jgi:hypothetical protein
MMLLGHFHELDDPEHKQFYLWRPRIEAICFCLQYGATIPWILFTIYHFIVRSFPPKDEH